jgi:hypothetical protein
MENTPQNQAFHNVPACCKFNQLPKPTQERLLSLIKNKTDNLVFETSNSLHSYVQIPLAIAWFGILFYLANDYLWSDFQLILFSVISLFAAVLLVYNLYKVVRSISSPTKNCLIITPHHVIDIQFNDVSYWNMDQLNAVSGTSIYQSGIYTSKQIDLSLVNGAKFFSVKNNEKADEIIDKIFEYKKLFLEATARIDNNYLNSTNDFIELRNQTLQSAKPASKVLNYAITGVASVILSAGLMSGAMSVNNYYDDLKSWNDVESGSRASSYRTYLQTHPNGRWLASADQKLQTLYEEAEQKYLTKLNKGFDLKAVEAVTQAIRYAKETKNYKVKLVFERSNQIPTDIVETLKKEFEVKRILAIGNAFTDENMNKRERDIFSRIANAFSIVIPDDILEFTNECNGECITFLVKYIVDSDNIYYDLRQKKLADNDRTWYPGVWFDWNFDIKTPNNPKTYDFQLTSDPASEITYDSNFDGENIDKEEFAKLLDKDKNIIYDSMAISAFDDFEKNLVYRLGIGEEPIRKPADDEETKPTPPTGSNQDVL